MNQNLTAVAVVTEALNRLWDAKGSIYAFQSDYNGKEKFACHAVSSAAKDLGGFYSTSEADKHPVVRFIHAQISKYIDGYDTMMGYLESKLSHSDFRKLTPEDFQFHRKRMLEQLLADYQQLARQVEVLEQVKVLRQGLHEDSDTVSEFVCDNVRFGLDLYGTFEEKNICHDIQQYIEGAFSVRGWLRKKRKPADWDSGNAARTVMIDTLIARYKAAMGEGEAA